MMSWPRQQRQVLDLTRSKRCFDSPKRQNDFSMTRHWRELECAWTTIEWWIILLAVLYLFHDNPQSRHMCHTLIKLLERKKRKTLSVFISYFLAVRRRTSRIAWHFSNAIQQWNSSLWWFYRWKYQNGQVYCSSHRHAHFVSARAR